MSFRTGPRALLIAGLFLMLTVRLTADDHIRTGGQYQEPYPYMTPGSVIRTDQRFHPGDPTPPSARIFMSCHAGDVIINPVATVTRVEVVIPAGVNLNWNTGLTPNITWPGTGAPASAGPRLFFVNYPNSKTMRFQLSSSFTPISDNFDITNIGFQTVGLALGTPSGPGNLNMNVTWDATGTPTVFPHIDDATIRVGEYCTAAPFSGSFNQVISPGTTVAMDDIVITENASATNGGIWATNGGSAHNGIRITIPAGVGVTFANVPTVTCSGSAVVPGGHMAGTSAVTYEDGFRTARIPVTSDFGPSDAVRISGLQLTTNAGATDQSFFLNIRTGRSNNLNDLTVPGSSRPSKQIVGLPTLTSAASLVFSVGDPATSTGAITIQDSPGTPKITAGDGIRLVIPNTINMGWDTSVGTVNCSGSAVPAKMALVQGPVTYSVDGGGNKIAFIPVGANFAANDNVTLNGLRFMNFTGASTATSLQLECVSTRVGIEATDLRAHAIGRPTISSAGDQVFLTSPPGPAVVAMSTITVDDDNANPRLGTSAGRVSQFFIIIPPTFNMTWQGAPGPGTATVSGKISSSVQFMTNRILRVTATSDWNGADTATISGLNFLPGAASSLPDNLELFLSQAAGSSVTNLDDKIIAIGGIPSMTSTTNQAFTVNDPSTAINNILLTDAASPSFQQGNTLQVVIPGSLNLEWDQAFIPAATPGAGTGTVGARSFPDAKTLNIPITFDFSGNQTLTISGARFTNFMSASAPLGLQLRVNIGGPIAATDNRSKAIGAPTIASNALSQVFGTGDASTLASPIVITDDGTTPRIRNGFDIRVRIPAAFNMEWDTTVTPTLTLGGPGAGAVGGVSYPTNKILLITIPPAGDFGPGKSVTITGARFRNFTAVSATDNLELEVNNTGAVLPNAFDSGTIKVGTRPTITSIVTRDLTGNGSIDQLLLTFSENINPGTTSVSTGLGFTVTGFTIAAGNAAGNTLGFGLVETGTPNTGATPVVSYDPLVGNLVDQDDPLTLVQTTLVATADGSRPTIIGFTTSDSDGDGRINQVQFTFSENLVAGQEDIADWTLIDADGTTDLLAGLTNADIAISGTYVTITLADTSGTLGTPRYRYLSNGLGGAIQDAAANFTLTITNNSAPVAIAGPDQSVSPQLVTLNAGASFDPDNQPVTFSWSQIAGAAVTLVPDLLNPAKATFFTVLPGAYTFEVRVSDGLVSVTDTVTVTVLNIAPTAVAILDHVTNSGSPVPLVGTLSSDINEDPFNPDIASYAWAQISGPAVAISNPTSPFAQVTPTLAGVYIFELTVTDSAGNTSTSQFTVRVNAGANMVPTADAGPDQVKVVGSLVTLDGRLSSTPAPNALTYSWAPTTFLTGANTATPTFTPAVPGVYTFQLTVTDSVTLVQSAVDYVSVFVHPVGNQPPVALAAKLSPLGTPEVGQLITLDSTGSSDPEGAPLGYGWRQVYGPAAILSVYNAAQTSFTPVTPGTYEFELVTTDGVQVSPPVRTRFQVVVAGGTPTSIVASLETPLQPNGHVLMSASPIVLAATSVTGTPSDVYWEQLAGPAVVLSTAPPDPPSFIGWYGYRVQFTPPIEGRYVFRVNALNFGNLLLATSTIEVVVDSGGNVAPSANAGPDANGTAETPMTLDGSGSTADSTRYYWTQLAGPPAVLSDPFAASPTFTPSAGGVYVFTLVTSDGTATGSSDLVVLTVAAAPGGAVVAGGSKGGGCGVSVEPLLLLAILAGLRRRLRR